MKGGADRKQAGRPSREELGGRKEGESSMKDKEEADHTWLPITTVMSTRQTGK